MRFKDLTIKCNCNNILYQLESYKKKKKSGVFSGIFVFVSIFVCMSYSEMAEVTVFPTVIQTALFWPKSFRTVKGICQNRNKIILFTHSCLL